jgi:predicted permease
MIHWIRRLLPRHATYQNEINEEIAYHLDRRVDALIAGGEAPDVARRRAELEFGNVGAARDELAVIDGHQAKRLEARAWRTDVMGDFRQALRVLRRAPAFSAFLLLILALAIGANSASFTVLRAVLVHGLPYRQPEQIVHLWETNGSAAQRTEASYPDFLDWRAQSRAFAALEGYNQTNFTVASSSGAMRLQGAYVTPGFLAMLGVHPILGHDFEPEENTSADASHVAISYEFWQRRYGGNPTVLDSSLVVDGTPFRITGVLPAGFHFAPLGGADAWRPLPDLGNLRTFRFNHWLRVVGRLRSTSSVEQAQEDMSLVMHRLAAQYPETNQGRDAVVVPLREELLGGIQPVLVAMFVAMALVLLIACANIAGLLLARALGREQEIHIRTALGASRWRLARQSLIESLLFALLGGALGVVLGQVGLKVVLHALPQGVLDHLPALKDSHVDYAVVGYTALVASLTALAAALGPILHAIASDRTVISTSNRTTSHRAMNRLRDGLVIGEIAISLVLLSGTALIGRSLLALLQVDLGFTTDQVVTARLALAGPEYNSDGSMQRFFERLTADVGTIPQVKSVGAISQLPLNDGGTNTLYLEGAPDRPASERPEVTTRIVVGDYFATIGIPLVAGRTFTPRDDSLAPRTIIISEALAHLLDPSGNVVGRRLHFYSRPDSAWEIIGIVGDVRTGSLEQDAPPTAYLSHLQAADNRFSLVVRTQLETDAATEGIRRAVSALDPNVPLYAEGKLSRIIDDAPSVATRRVPLLLLSIFAASALVLAMVGLYGVVSYNVARRARELGIRMALGAQPARIRWGVLRYGGALALIGTTVGIGIAMALSRFIRGWLYGVGPLDPAAYLGAAGLLVVVTLLACYLPARRATRVALTITLNQ